MDVMNLIFAGGLDGGKSALVGRIFHERGEISDGLLRRLRRHAEAVGKPTHYFAFFTDTKLDERGKFRNSGKFRGHHTLLRQGIDRKEENEARDAHEAR